MEQKIPEDLKKNKTSCIIGLVADPERLSDIRRNRVAIMKDQNLNKIMRKHPFVINENMSASKALGFMSEKKITSFFLKKFFQ